MRTTVTIDPKTPEELVEATGMRSRSAALHEAAKEYLRRKKLNDLKAAWRVSGPSDVRTDARDADRRRERFLETLRGHGHR